METTVTFTTTSASAATITDAAKVQRVTKKSSDELLRKFAEVGTDDKKELRLIKRRKKKIKENQSESISNGATTVVERRSLLPATVSRKSALLRQLRVRDNRNKSSLFGTIHKTWRRTVEGASRVFMEKHYHSHKRLINDIV
ncbi:unnamed protein product [Trifolium pratense]|uniref:Uncharacterized protein n=1 Tax=Trifolium pratense TaxID=57577 RepID=A0ACB0LPK3_TRIPR|nr:unnamed protein product [Trifolium pratense]